MPQKLLRSIISGNALFESETYQVSTFQLVQISKQATYAKFLVFSSLHAPTGPMNRNFIGNDNTTAISSRIPNHK